MRWIALFVLAACSGAPAPAPVLPAPGAEVAAIDAVYETFTRAYETLDPDLVASLYTDEAKYLGPGNDVLRDRAAIRDNFAGSFRRTAERGERITIEFDRFDRRIAGDMAFEVGYYRLTRTKGDGSSTTSRGKFAVVLLRQADGSWRFHVDSYSGVPEDKEGDNEGADRPAGGGA